MRTRNIIGRRIVAVEQRRRDDVNKGQTWEVCALVLENGVRLCPVVHEQVDGYDYVVSLEEVRHASHDHDH